MDLVRTTSAEERRRRVQLEQHAASLEQQTAAMGEELAATQQQIAQLGGAAPDFVPRPVPRARRPPAASSWTRGWLAGKGVGDVFGVPQAPIQELAFGDELAHPITVREADFEACVLPDQQAALVKATFLVTNERVPATSRRRCGSRCPTAP